MSGAYLYNKQGRTAISTVRSHLRDSLEGGSFMDPALMRGEEKDVCRWVGYGFSKGVTSPALVVTVFGTPTKMHSGWHGEMIQGFPGVDPNPACYAPDHEKGFADFVRWVYFASPDTDKGVLGIDFSLSERATAGIADSLKRVVEVARVCVEHGIPADIELVLLNPRMCEVPCLTELRKQLGLHTIADWLGKAETLFGDNGKHCHVCGLPTRDAEFLFCYRCGATHGATTANPVAA